MTAGEPGLARLSFSKIGSRDHRGFCRQAGGRKGRENMCTIARSIGLIFLVSTLAALLPRPAAGDSETFRCGRWVVNRELSPAEVLAKCGEPTTREVRADEIWARRANGSTHKVTVRVETWRYDRGNRAAAMLVTIIDGRITEMRREK